MAKTRSKLPKMAAPVLLPEPDLISDAQPVDAEVISSPTHSGRYRVRSLKPNIPIDIPRGDGTFHHLYCHFLACEAPMSADLMRLLDNKVISIEEII
jgi:hypothetical protein